MTSSMTHCTSQAFHLKRFIRPPSQALIRSGKLKSQKPAGRIVIKKHDGFLVLQTGKVWSVDFSRHRRLLAFYSVGDLSIALP